MAFMSNMLGTCREVYKRRMQKLLTKTYEEENG